MPPEPRPIRPPRPSRTPCPDPRRPDLRPGGVPTMPWLRFRRARLTIAELMGAVAVLAVACAWPVLLFPTIGTLLGLLLLKLGLSPVQVLVAMTVLGLILGLCLP